MFEQLGIIILAGGKSSRMGKDKSLLPFNTTPLIEFIIEKIRLAGFNEIIIVTNDPIKYSFLQDVQIIKDYYPGLGPLAGIHAGLLNSKYENNFVMPCDMPFLSLKLISDLLVKQGDCKVVVPKIQEKYQPLAAIYHKDCVESIEFLLNKNESKVIKLYDLVQTCYLQVKEDKVSFFNINTPEDFLKAKGIIRVEKNGES